jgi:hypothetical protein
MTKNKPKDPIAPGPNPNQNQVNNPNPNTRNPNSPNSPNLNPNEPNEPTPSNPGAQNQVDFQFDFCYLYGIIIN